MTKKLVLLGSAVFLAAIFAGCSIFGSTGVKGSLILEPGQTGDVRNARIELYETSDLTGDPVKIGQSESSGSDLSNADFKLEDVLTGYYYLLAWKDMDGDGEVSGGDLVGVYGGTYKPGEGGQKLTVEDGKMTDVGEISMAIFVEPLTVTASGSTSEGGYHVAYTYSFNYDVTLSSFTITVPGYNSFTDYAEKGARTANQNYTTQDYVINGGTILIPTGSHVLNLKGTYDGDSFDITETVTVQ